jgi:purine-binding chemotaxis protein CheW
MRQASWDVTARPYAASASADFVTVVVERQLFGLPIEAVHDVFIAEAITPVPLAPPEIAGLLNLRGRVVTALCLRQILRLPAPASVTGQMVVGLEHASESFGLVVDGVSEVQTLPLADIRPNPMNLDPRWAGFSRGIYRLEDGLLVVLDIDAILDPQAMDAARTDHAPKGQAA